MSTPVDPLQLPWLAATRRRPLCDVPWLGNVTVAEDAQVEFCCYSPARVGNVRERSFAEIWNGPEMRRIRSSLANGQFPPECCTPACPIRRGDTAHFIRRRIDHLAEGWPGQGAPQCSGTILAPQRLRHGELLTVDLEFAGGPLQVVVDVVLAITMTDGATRFVPDLAPVPQPCCTGWTIGGPTPLRRRMVESCVSPDFPTGRYTLHAAAFAAEASPLAASMCGWAATAAVHLEP